MKTLGGFGAMLYGAYAIYYAQMNPTFDTTPMWWLQVLAAIIVGGYFGLSDFLPQVWRFALRLKANLQEPNGVVVTTVKTETKTDDTVIEIRSLEEKDMASLYYLTERCKAINDGAAYKLCRDLNDVFFTLHHPQKAEEVKGAV